MKIVIATPLYPPDIAEPAPYAKELAKRLSEHNSVSIVLFGRLPETIPKVSFVTVDKRQWLPVRLFHYLRALWSVTKDADVLYVLDGASVELTSGFLSLVRRIPLVVHHGDEDANAWAESKLPLRLIKKFIRARATHEVHLLPPPRPEILPYDPHPLGDFAEYERTWRQHTQQLESLFAKLINHA